MGVILQVIIGDISLTRAVTHLTGWLSLAYLAYLNVIWVQNLHVGDVYDNSKQNDTYHVGINIQRSTNLCDNDSDDINLYSFFHITNKFYENAKYNSKIIQEFKLFVQFMVHEFSIENLLFLINVIQFKQFLILNNYTNESYWETYKFDYDLKDFINSTKSIVELIENSKTKKKYNALIPFLDKIFFTFIQANAAPFEVNISDNLRSRVTSHIADIIDDNNDSHDQTRLTEAILLHDILPDLIVVSSECMSMIEFSWMRYSVKAKSQIN